MNWQTLQHPDDSDVRPVERLSFDILRALLANRQASSPTVRALSGQSASTNAAQSEPMTGRLQLLAGHTGSPAIAQAAGAFFSARGGDQPVLTQGERHA